MTNSAEPDQFAKTGHVMFSNGKIEPAARINLICCNNVWLCNVYHTPTIFSMEGQGINLVHSKSIHSVSSPCIATDRPQQTG